MPEPAALGPRRLWRTVVRPLVEDGEGDIISDSSNAAIVEGLLATTQATLHAVTRSDALDELSQLYSDRIVFHRDPGAAWKAVVRCRLAVLDIAHASSGHVEPLTAFVRSDAHAPFVLLEGVAERTIGDPVLATLAEHGWAVVELPGFERIRLLLPGGQRVLDGDTLDAILMRLSSDAPDEKVSAAGGDAPKRIEELTDRLRELERSVAESEAARELAERGRAASEDIVAALRRFNDTARGDLEHARRESETLRRLLESSRAQAAAARAQNGRLARAVVAVRQDLARLQDARSWRLAHWLMRGARILTFRKPGRTDALSKAIERVDALPLRGEDDR